MTMAGASLKSKHFCTTPGPCLGLEQKCQVTAVSPLLLEGPNLLFYGSVRMSGGYHPPFPLFVIHGVIETRLSHTSRLSHFVPDGWIISRGNPGNTPKTTGLLPLSSDGDKDKTFAMRRKATYVLHILSAATPTNPRSSPPCLERPSSDSSPGWTFASGPREVSVVKDDSNPDRPAERPRGASREIPCNEFEA